MRFAVPAATHFTQRFSGCHAGLTIKDRLRVLQPSDPDSYYASRELVPPDMLDDIKRTKIVITNYHAFKLRERLEISKGGRALLEGRHGAPIDDPGNRRADDSAGHAGSDGPQEHYGSERRSPPLLQGEARRPRRRRPLIATTRKRQNATKRPHACGSTASKPSNVKLVSLAWLISPPHLFFSVAPAMPRARFSIGRCPISLSWMPSNAASSSFRASP
jgi:hypothetical protein